MSKKRLSQTKKNIVFLGHMGSGKSTIGRGLSKKLGLDFYDTDKEIEKEMGQKIAKIFYESGEIIFRNIEKKINNFFMLYYLKFGVFMLPNGIIVIEKNIFSSGSKSTL